MHCGVSKINTQKSQLHLSDLQIFDFTKEAIVNKHQQIIDMIAEFKKPVNLYDKIHYQQWVFQ